VLLNAADPALQADPFPLYRRLREEAPVIELDDGTWLVTRHADVSALLRNRSISSAQVGGNPGAPVAELEVNGRNLMIASDPPVHTRRRGAVAPQFTVHPVHALRPAIEAHVEHRLDEVAARLAAGGVVDLVPTFCARIPMDTLCSLLGLPLDDEGRLRRWTTDLIDGIDPWAGPDAAARAGAALAEVCPYLERFLDERRVDPTDDLLSALATSPDLTPDEQLHNAVLFLNAGLDTSGDLVANALGLLLDTPGAWDTLVADPERVAPMAVEEAARFDSPVQVSMRRTIGPVEVGGTVIPEGRGLLLGLGAANRDPEVFTDADRFEVERDDRRHVAFGGGAHLCLGAPVARLEVSTSLRAMAERFPGLTLAGPSTWRPRLAFRGRASLLVTAEG
jgi:cytochrome P450